MSAELSGVPARVHLGNIMQHLIWLEHSLNGWSLLMTMITDKGQLPGSFLAGTLATDVTAKWLQPFPSNWVPANLRDFVTGLLSETAVSRFHRFSHVIWGQHFTTLFLTSMCSHFASRKSASMCSLQHWSGIGDWYQLHYVTVSYSLHHRLCCLVQAHNHGWKNRDCQDPPCP